MAEDDRLRVFAGFDWATQLHVVSLVDADGKSMMKPVTVADTMAGIEDMCTLLVEKSGCEPTEIGVAIELTRGRLVETLMERGFVVFGVNPKQLDRFRDRFGAAGAKSDAKDAFVLASSLRTDRVLFRRTKMDEPLVVELREWNRELAELVEEQGRTANQMRDLLRRYYPQMLDITDDVAAPFMMDLFELAPSPAAAARIEVAAVEEILQHNRIRKHDAQDVLDLLHQKPFFVAPGTVEGVSARVKNLAARARVLRQQSMACDKQVQRLCADLGAAKGDAEGQPKEHRDAAILQSLAGVGWVVCATMLTEAAEAIRNRDYHALRALTGVAPVSRSSGKAHGVLMRRACNVRLRNGLFHWARVACQKDPRAKAHYAELRARGKTYGRALRAVGDRLLKMACAMLRDGTLYDPERRGRAAPFGRLAAAPSMQTSA